MEPQLIDDSTFYYPARVKHLMPGSEEPGYPEYRKNWLHAGWGVQLFDDWFYSGLRLLELVPKPGIDREVAFRHILTIMRSFEPSHEDKTAACGWLLEHWFESAIWETPQGKRGSGKEALTS